LSCDRLRARKSATFAKRRWKRLSRSEGGSDFREAKVEATFAKRRWMRLSRSEGGCDFMRKVDATFYAIG
jgi:hypothetical protein